MFANFKGKTHLVNVNKRWREKRRNFLTCYGQRYSSYIEWSCTSRRQNKRFQGWNWDILDFFNSNNIWDMATNSKIFIFPILCLCKKSQNYYITGKIDKFNSIQNYLCYKDVQYLILILEIFSLDLLCQILLWVSDDLK